MGKALRRAMIFAFDRAAFEAPFYIDASFALAAFIFCFKCTLLNIDTNKSKTITGKMSK